MAYNTSKELVQFIFILLMVALVSGQSPQCPNNLAVYNPNLRTTCVNGSTSPLVPPNPALPANINTLYSISVVHRTCGHRRG